MGRNALTVLVAVVVSCGACFAISWAMQPQSGVAVVDLDEVSRQLGRQSEMMQNLQEKTKQTQQKLVAIEQDALSQLQEARKTFGDALTPEQAKKLQEMQQSASIQLNQIKQKAELEVNSHRQQLVNSFREQARPVVAKIAKKHGFSTVMTRNDMFLFSYEQTVDITEEVVQAMAAEGAAPPATATAQAKAPAAQSNIQQVSHEVSKTK